MSRSFYPGRVDLQVRDERIPNVRAEGGQDRRSGAEYLAALERETDASLRQSTSWRAGRPLEDHERWPNLTSADLPRGDSPAKGRWAK